MDLVSDKAPTRLVEDKGNWSMVFKAAAAKSQEKKSNHCSHRIHARV